MPIHMQTQLRVEQLASPPVDGKVHHYDELNEEFKHLFPDLVEKSTTQGTLSPQSTVRHGDCVKFTDYYRIMFQ